MSKPSKKIAKVTYPLDHEWVKPQRVEFSDLADRLATILADILDHDDCPDYLAARICELHNGLVTEFNCEVAHDIRLRFADAVCYAAENDRPAN